MISRDEVFSIIVVLPASGELQPWLPALDVTAEICELTSIWDRLDSDIPDVIIATACDKPHVELFDTIHATFSIEERPTIVLFSDEPPTGYGAALVDLVLPRINHPMVYYQIQHAIERKIHVAGLQVRIAALEADNRDLKRKQTARQRSLDEIDLLKNTIVRNVTHELNTPLLQVKSAVALIAEDVKNNSLVEYALQATARLEAVVRNITQLAASLDEMGSSPFIVRDCIDTALRDLRRTWEYKHHIARVSVDIEEALPLAFGDRQGITTVLQQIIDNALKFSEKSVEVSAHLHEDRIRIRVHDYGIGIPQDQLESIFESFYQIDSSTRRSYGGTGVGLANVRLILDRHGSDIEVQSEVGSGTTFSFSLPCIKPSHIRRL